MPAEERQQRAGRVAGLDGCPAGWFVATADAGLTDVECFVAGTIAQACEQLDDCGAIGIDMPIGLPDAGSRACDVLARRLLAPRRGVSVFPAPIRPVLESHGYRDACAIRESIDGKRMSRQAYNLINKIKELDSFLQKFPGFAERLYEVHPELSFAALNGGKPVTVPKRRPEGLVQRYELLGRFFAQDDLDAALTSWPRSKVARDDVLDAFAVLETARRIAAGDAGRVPELTEYDGFGLEMAIWY
jgi:predicted RNase H-like nuclease